jgi:cell division protein FtsL
MKLYKRNYKCYLLLLLAVILSACSGTYEAIEHRNLETEVNMSQSIFLDPEIRYSNKNIFIEVRNTSDMQDIDFQHIIESRLKEKGYNIVQNPRDAAYRLQVNVLYINPSSKGMTAEAAAAGGFGGAIIGAATGRGSTRVTGGLIGTAVGSLVGAAVGSQFKIDSFMGIADIQIQEKVPGGVNGNMTTNAEQGTSTTLRTSRYIKSDYQTYKTRIAIEAKETNMDKLRAAQVISDKLGAEIANIF